MNAILDIRNRIDSSNATIREIEQMLLERPEDFSLRLVLGTEEKHRRDLELQFALAAQAAGKDICRYRILGDRATVAPWAFNASLQFQRLYSLVYSAVAGKVPKQRATISADHEFASTFEVAYSFTGSFGLVLTLTNERLLFGGTDLDDAMREIRHLWQLRTAEDIRQIADTLGIAVVRALFSWSKAHSEHEFGAELGWSRGPQSRYNALIQYQELRQLEEAISSTSDTVTEVLFVTGTLIGADVGTKSFHFISSEGEDIRGRFFDAIGEAHHVELPTRKKLKLRRTSELKFSTDEEKVQYFLEEIQEP